jgi:hypothetical protein
METSCMTNPFPWNTVQEDLGIGHGEQRRNPINPRSRKPKMLQNLDEKGPRYGITGAQCQS